MPRRLRGRIPAIPRRLLLPQARLRPQPAAHGPWARSRRPVAGAEVIDLDSWPTRLDTLLRVNQFFTDLAGHARTYPGARLERWWPTAACARVGAFADSGHITYTPAIHPDGHAIYTEAGRTVAVFVEHDTGSEPLHVLIDKLPRYADLARATGRDWPVLFWLHSTARERHLHDRLAHTQASVHAVPVATATRDHAAAAGLSPAEEIWWLHAHPAPLRLTDLPGGWPAGTRPIAP